MGAWYESRLLLNTLILIMVVAFISFMLQPSYYPSTWDIVIFLAMGTFIIIRGIIRIVMRMKKNNPEPNTKKSGY